MARRRRAGRGALAGRALAGVRRPRGVPWAGRAAPRPACAMARRTSLRKGVWRRLHESVAYVETDVATGSGFVVVGGYVVTNAHVIDPYDRATVVFEGGRRVTDVPVHAVDLLADLALLGPIAELPAVAPLAPGTDLEKGDTVFLVGYPGETERTSPDVTISQGIVARLRTADPFGLRYVQTDAAIGGGQSGGAGAC